MDKQLRPQTEVSNMCSQKSAAALISCCANPFVLEWALRHRKPALCTVKIKEYTHDFRKNHRGQQRGSHILWPTGNTDKIICFYKWGPSRISLTPSKWILSICMDQQLRKNEKLPVVGINNDNQININKPIKIHRPTGKILQKTLLCSVNSLLCPNLPLRFM